MVPHYATSSTRTTVVYSQFEIKYFSLTLLVTLLQKNEFHTCFSNKIFKAYLLHKGHWYYLLFSKDIPYILNILRGIQSWFITFALRGHYDEIINVDNTEEEKRETLSTSPGLGLLGPLLVWTQHRYPAFSSVVPPKMSRASVTQMILVGFILHRRINMTRARPENISIRDQGMEKLVIIAART